MKKSAFTLLALMLLTPFFVSAQSLEGKWDMGGTAEDGSTMVSIVTFHEDGTLTVDFGNDGTIEVQAKYSMDGNKISISDSSEGSPCEGQTGVYEASVEGDTATFTLVEDTCDARKQAISTMKRVE